MYTSNRSTRREAPLLLALALAIFIAGGSSPCRAEQEYQAKFRDLEVKLRTVKKQLQFANGRKDSDLTGAERRKLEEDLRTIVEKIDRDARELRRKGAEFGLPPRPWDNPSPESKLDRIIALMEAAVDYCIMLAMQMQQEGTTKDADAAASMIVALESMEKNLRFAANVRSRALRRTTPQIAKKELEPPRRATRPAPGPGPTSRAGTPPFALTREQTKQASEIAKMVVRLEPEQAIRHRMAAYVEMLSKTEGSAHHADQAALEAIEEEVEKEIWESQRLKDEQLTEAQREQIQKLVEMIREMMKLQANQIGTTPLK